MVHEEWISESKKVEIHATPTYCCDLFITVLEYHDGHTGTSTSNSHVIPKMNFSIRQRNSHCVGVNIWHEINNKIKHQASLDMLKKANHQTCVTCMNRTVTTLPVLSVYRQPLVLCQGWSIQEIIYLFIYQEIIYLFISSNFFQSIWGKKRIEPWLRG